MELSIVIFGSILKSNIWHIFYVFLDLVILVYINPISIDLYEVKCLYLHLFCVIAMIISGRMLI